MDGWLISYDWYYNSNHLHMQCKQHVQKFHIPSNNISAIVSLVYFTTYIIRIQQYLVAVCLSSNVVGHINKVTLHKPGLY